MIYDEKTAQKVANLLLSIDVVLFRFNPPFTYTTGLKSPIYMDNRLVMSHPDVRKKIIDEYIKAIHKNIHGKIDVISATAVAAIPQGAWIAERLNLPMVFVRASAKLYGRGLKVEGIFKKGSRVLIIEDHISTAKSIVDNAESIRTLGGKVTHAIATTTYETELSKKILQEHDITLFSLTTGKIITENAFKNNMLTKDEKKSVDLWFTNQIDWVRKKFKKIS